jgi:glutamyl-tRNA synthetase
VKKPQLFFYQAIREDLAWLGCKWDSEFIQSERLEIYYEHAEKLLRDGNAYVCTCKPEEFRKKITAKRPCPCRFLAGEVNVLRWRGMLDGTFSEGKAVLRIKTDFNHPNPAVRDWPALRIINTQEYPHPRVGSKYCVWPLYNFAAGLDDHLLGITHIIRGKEHLTNQVRQEYMYRHFGWEYPETIHYGRLKISGATLSKSRILQGIKSGLYKSWADPRLATFAALRRRGITPEAITRLIIDVGPNTADVVLSWENLYAHNRKIIDQKANRYFFVQNPKKMTIKNIPRAFIIRNPLHPEHPERGFRSFEIKIKNGESQILFSEKDFGKMKPESKIRLMGLLNLEVQKVKKDHVEGIFQSESHEMAKKMGAPLIHWIPVGSGMPCEVVMPDSSLADGIAEDGCRNLTSDQIIQFERFGFVRVDTTGDKLVAFFTHR